VTLQATESVLAVRRAVSAQVLPEPVRTHAVALARRLVLSRGPDEVVSDLPAVVAGLEYLAARVERPELEGGPVAGRHGLELWRVLRSLDDLRMATEYRAYVGEWIRDGCPAYSEEPEAAVAVIDPPEESLTGLEPWLQGEEHAGEEAGLEPVAPVAIPAPPLDVATVGERGVPSRWIAPFLPYPWQYAAADAWERNHGRGIMQVVTGAGKTALALYLYARLLDRVEQAGHEVQLIVVVPRIELARQWAREARRLLRLTGLRLGQYHSEASCTPAHQDILIITQDSARRILPAMRINRPVMLVADECHRLGAPAASRILNRDYSWTLGLSATPERGGDLGFEEVLVPRLGPVVWKYGYADAVRDGIIAPFTIHRVKVQFTLPEQVEYDDRSEKVRRLLDGLKSSYPGLRAAQSARFWQVMGDLRKRHPDDQRFEVLTAAANERRAIVHFAEQKQQVVRSLADRLGPPTRVLCFHERIEAAERLSALCRAAGRSVAIYHSQIPEPARSDSLESFRDGEASWLIACKSLDEGLDIPAVDTIVIVAGTRSPRQLIQRLGRALRRKDENRTAAVFLVEVAGVDDTMLDQEGLGELSDAAEAVIETVWPEQGPPAGSLASTAPATPVGAGGRGGSPVPGVAPWRPDPSRAVRVPPTQVHRQGGSIRPRPQGGDEGQGLLSQIRGWGAALRRRFTGDSWTGTPGNQSYYDKDPSPD
jgi:superfamily II DNA or RNA helicase